jgi:hypothetical protein
MLVDIPWSIWDIYIYNRYRYGNEPVMDYLSLGMVISRANGGKINENHG